MPYPKENVRTPTNITDFWHYMDTIDGSIITFQYAVRILDQSGILITEQTGDETIAMNPGQINQMEGVVSNRRAGLPTDLAFPVGHQLGRTVWEIYDPDNNQANYTFIVNAVELDSVGAFVQTHVIDDYTNLSPSDRGKVNAFLNARRAQGISEIL